MAILLCGAGEFMTISSATVVPFIAQSSGTRRWASMESFRGKHHAGLLADGRIRNSLAEKL
jgi:hypothetical protein